MFIRTLQLFLLFLAITPNFGFYSNSSFIILSIVIALSIFNLFFYKRMSQKPSPTALSIIQGVFIILFIYAWSVYGGYYQNPLDIIVGKNIYLIILILCFVLIKISVKQKNFRVLLIGSFIILSLWTIHTSPNPNVDVFIILKEAPQKLLQGINPYQALYTKIYPKITPDYFTYLPLSFFYMMPFVLLFHDPRYGIIFAYVLIVHVLSKIFPMNAGKKIPYLLLMAFLFLPRSFFMIEHSYLDPVIFMFFVLYRYCKEHNNHIGYFFLGAFFTVKQDILLLFPLFVTKDRLMALFKIKNFVLFALPFTLVLLFLFWSKKDFLHDTLSSVFPTTTEVPPFLLSLSFPIFLLKHNIIKNMYTSIVISSSIFFILAITVMLQKIAATTKLYTLLLFFVYFHYVGFFNHYYLIALFLVFDTMAHYFSYNENNKGKQLLTL